MRISSNVLKLAILVLLGMMTVLFMLFDKTESAVDAMTHIFAFAVGTVLHSMVQTPPN